MNDIDRGRVDVGVRRFSLVKKNDDAPYPFESVEGGDGLPVTVTMFDEQCGVAVAQLVTYEPEAI